MILQLSKILIPESSEQPLPFNLICALQPLLQIFCRLLAHKALPHVSVPYWSHLDSSSSFPEIVFLMALGSQIFRQSLVVLLKCPSKTSLKSRSCKFWRVVFPALAYLRHNFASYHSIFLIQKKKKSFILLKLFWGFWGFRDDK